VEREARRLAPSVARYLDLGRFHTLLPPDAASETVVRFMDLPRFEALYHAADLVTPQDALRKRLWEVLE
jgi:hypothetical protein